MWENSHSHSTAMSAHLHIKIKFWHRFLRLNPRVRGEHVTSQLSWVAAQPFVTCVCSVYLVDELVLVFNTRAYFRKKKCAGIRRLIKNCPFLIFFFNLNQKCQRQLPIKRDLTFTCPSGLSKCPFIKQKRPFFEAESPFPRAILI